MILHIHTHTRDFHLARSIILCGNALTDNYGSSNYEDDDIETEPLPQSSSAVIEMKVVIGIYTIISKARKVL